jgi:hypothetical protein
MEDIAVKRRNRDLFFRVTLIIKDQILFLFDLPSLLHPIKMRISDKMSAIDEEEEKDEQ